MKRLLYLLFVMMTVHFVSCSKDNYKEPKFLLSGIVTYQNDTIQVRSNGVQLELWQPGYQLFSKIPIYVNQNGTFSTSLFKGDYQLITLKDNGPWVNMADTADIHFSGNQDYKLELTPNFLVKNLTFSYNSQDSSVSAHFGISKTGEKNISSVSLYISTTDIVDNVNYTYNVTLPVEDADIDKNFDLSLMLDLVQINGDATKIRLYNAMKANGYCFARIGIKSTGAQESNFSPVTKIQF